MDRFGNDWMTAAWQGYTPIWKVFWIYNILVALGMTIISMLLGDLSFFKYVVYVVLVLPSTVFVLVAIWRCAFNTKYPPIGYLARGYVIFVAVSAVGLV